MCSRHWSEPLSRWLLSCDRLAKLQTFPRSIIGRFPVQSSIGLYLPCAYCCPCCSFKLQTAAVWCWVIAHLAQKIVIAVVAIVAAQELPLRYISMQPWVCSCSTFHNQMLAARFANGKHSTWWGGICKRNALPDWANACHLQILQSCASEAGPTQQELMFHTVSLMLLKWWACLRQCIAVRWIFCWPNTFELFRKSWKKKSCRVWGGLFKSNCSNR